MLLNIILYVGFVGRLAGYAVVLGWIHHHRSALLKLLKNHMMSDELTYLLPALFVCIYVV